MLKYGNGTGAVHCFINKRIAQHTIPLRSQQLKQASFLHANTKESALNCNHKVPVLRHIRWSRETACVDPVGCFMHFRKHTDILGNPVACSSHTGKVYNRGAKEVHSFISMMALEFCILMI